MNKQTALQIVSTKIGKRDHLITNGTIANELYLAQLILEDGAFLPWFLIRRETFSTAVATAEVALPVDLLRESEEGRLTVQDSTGSWVPVSKGTEDHLTGLWFKAPASSPKNYHMDVSGFTFYPTPDAVYPMRFKGFFRDADILNLGGTDTNLWLTHAPSVLIARAAMVLAKNLQNPQLASALSQEYQEALSGLIGADTARDVAARDIIKGG